jgi:hypothetical protein
MGGILSTALGLLGQKAVQTTYSFRDLSGVLVNPVLAAVIPIVGGNIGNGNLTVSMATERTTHLTGNDGVVMPSYKAGDSGHITIEMQQTSSLHHALLALFNSLKTSADSGDVSNWASTTISLRTTLDGSGHLCTGVSFQKVPDKPYAADGQNVTWTLMAASIINQ